MRLIDRPHRASAFFKRLVGLALVVAATALPLSAQAPAGPPPTAPAGQPAMDLGLLLQPQIGISPDATGFQLPQARIRVTGRLARETIFVSQLNLVSSGQVLLEAALAHAVTERLAIEAGVYRAPFSREILTFIGYLPLENRARVTRSLAPFWQLGAGLTYQIVPGMVQSRFGVFNGTGGAIQPNDNQSFMYVGRFEATAGIGSTRWDLGFNAAYSNDESVNVPGVVSNFAGQRLLIGADFVADAERLYVIGETIYGSLDARAGQDLNPFGAMGRLGWRFTPATSVVFGLDYFDPDVAVAGHDDVLLAVAFSRYVGQHLRFLVDYTFPTDAVDSGNLVLRMQVAKL